MEELSKIAMAYYQASSDDLQELARNFFSAMDNDGDGNIDQREFMEFMRDEGYGQMTNPSFFSQLDHDKNGTLDFVEVMTLYYIVKSGRPFCNCCDKFITSTYLSCVGCLEDPIGGSFYLCLDCYSMQKCDHTHNSLSCFLDNYSLLRAMNKSKSSEPNSPATRSRQVETVPAPDKLPSVTNQTGDPYQPQPAYNHRPSQNVAPSVHNNLHPVASSAIVPQRQHWKTALGALDTAIQITSISSTFCSIL